MDGRSFNVDKSTATATTMNARFHTKSSTTMGLERVAKPSDMDADAEASLMSPSTQSPRRNEAWFRAAESQRTRGSPAPSVGPCKGLYSSISRWREKEERRGMELVE